jgi:endonuclease-3
MPVRLKPRQVVTKATRKPARGKWPPDPNRVQAILQGLERLYPEATCELEWKTPFQLLCMTILSAQCTDERVNMVAPMLFARFPTAAALSKAPLPVLEGLIRSTGFFRQKAKAIKASAAILVEEHGGDLPRTMAELQRLPGVARKTANVVLGTAFGLAEGMVVDTHVQRLSQRLGLVRHGAPEKVEQDLMRIVERSAWILFGHRLIWHGRRVCWARKPNCGHCLLSPHCPSAFKESARV